jgi:choline-sulfatase
VLSEYHAMGSRNGAFMVRCGDYKYVHYVSHPPQLFNLKDDIEELTDLACDPQYEEVLQQMDAKLRTYCDPVEVDLRAKQRQAYLLAQQGGRSVALAAGDLGFTPPPVQVTTV